MSATSLRSAAHSRSRAPVKIVPQPPSALSPAGAAGDSAARCGGGALRFPVTGGALALARVVEVPVDSGAGHVEEVSDLLDSVVASVVELLREGNLLGEDGEHPEHRATFGRRRVNTLLGDVQTDAALA